MGTFAVSGARGLRRVLAVTTSGSKESVLVASPLGLYSCCFFFRMQGVLRRCFWVRLGTVKEGRLVRCRYPTAAAVLLR